MEINVKLQAFEGPLDLLLHLIEKNKVNIYDIPISMITDQYLEYVDKMDKTDLDYTSEFLIMAATLLDIKSRMLLPKEKNEVGEEEDPRAELVEQLIEYKLFKQVAQKLKEQKTDAGRLFFKKSTVPKEVLNYRPPVDPSAIVGDTTLAQLNIIFQDVIQRQESKVDPIRSKFGKIKREPVSMSDCWEHVRSVLKKQKSLQFRELLQTAGSKEGVVVTFLVVLELMKNGFLHAEQVDTCGEIELSVLKDPDEFTIGNEDE